MPYKLGAMRIQVVIIPCIMIKVNNHGNFYLRTSIGPVRKSFDRFLPPKHLRTYASRLNSVRVIFQSLRSPWDGKIYSHPSKLKVIKYHSVVPHAEEN